MRTLSAGWRFLAAAVVLAGAFLPRGLAAPAPAVPEPEAAVSPVEKARQGLDRVVTLKIDRQSLSAAVAMLRDRAKLHIVLDVATIQQAGINPDQPPTPVDLDVKGVKARAVLRKMVAPYGLTFVVIGDAVVVTTEDMAAARQMAQRVSVNLDKAEFAAALKQLGRETGVNLALDPRVEKEASAKVSLQIDDMPLEKAVRLLAEMAGLKPVRVGNALFVTRKDIANEMRADPDLNAPSPGLPNFMDMDGPVMINAAWLVGSGRIVAAPAAGPADVAEPIQIKSTDRAAPVDADKPADPPTAPAKQDGDK